MTADKHADERTDERADKRAAEVAEKDALRALAHPLRLRILSLLTGAVLSAAEVARELGTTQANASYHLRRLEAAGLLEVAEEVRIRGGRARRYRHDPASGSRLRTRDREDGLVVAEALAAELRRRMAYRRPGGHGLTTDAELWVDPAVWEQVRDTVREASTLLHDRAVPPRSAGAVRVGATLALFLMHDDDPVQPPGPTPGVEEVQP